MDIAAMSTVLSQAKVQQQASLSVMRIAMDSGQHRMNEMLNMVQQSTKVMEQSVNPHVGRNIDVSV